MAIEDEIINIEDLEIAKEIKIGDQILLETTDGTKLIDFKDFIIGTDNITFYDKLSGGNFLQSKDISALEANFSTVSASVDTLTALSIGSSIDSINARINGFERRVQSIVDKLETSTGTELVENQFSHDKVGFSVQYKGAQTSSYGSLGWYGTEKVFAGTNLGSNLVLGAHNNNSLLGLGFSYTATGDYTLSVTINGLLALDYNVIRSAVNNQTAYVGIPKDIEIIAKKPYAGSSSRRTSYTVSGTGTSKANDSGGNFIWASFNISYVANMVQGEKISIHMPNRWKDVTVTGMPL